jgi:glycosyltransferase involved in cell wall biosynthesis
MHRGGVETWLMQLLRNADPARLRMDFLVDSVTPGDYDDEIRARGAKVLPCPSRSRPLEFRRRFRRTLAEHGPYDAIHTHVQQFGGYVLWLAEREAIPVRIAHSHNDTTERDRATPWSRRAWHRWLTTRVARHASRGLAASELAAASLFGKDWHVDDRWRVLHCGLDFQPFRAEHDRAGVRAGLGLPVDALVIGHIGRFLPQKNHALLLRIAEEVCRREPRARFVLVGDGPLAPTMRGEVQRLGLGDRVIFGGVRSDIPALLDAFDVFLLPSLHEGLPLVGIEAQAAGLPIVLSTTVTRELAAIPSLFRWLSLADSVDEWAAMVLAAVRQGRMPKAESIDALSRTDFSVHAGLAALESEYRR